MRFKKSDYRAEQRRQRAKVIGAAIVIGVVIGALSAIDWSKLILVAMLALFVGLRLYALFGRSAVFWKQGYYRAKQRSRGLIAAGIIGAGAAIGVAGFSGGHASMADIILPGPVEKLHIGASFECQVSSITDGDTFRCRGGRRIRLSGVAARETDGTCSPGHPCPVASAEAATAELTRLASGEQLQCEAVGKTYGRTAAFCRTTAGVDLSCAMVASGTALRWKKYWGGHSC